MPNYVEEHGAQEIPKAVGIEGYVAVVRRILELARVQEIKVTPGKVAYMRFRKEGEPERELEVDLTTLEPYAVIRNTHTVEVTPITDSNAAVVMAQLFAQIHMDGYNPSTIIVGPGEHFRRWHLDTTSIMLSEEESYGLPVLSDRQIPDETLIICAAYGRRAALVDTVRAYKVAMPLLRSR